MPRYRLFGLIVRSDVEFTSRLGAASPSAPADLRYSCGHGSARLEALPEPVYRSSFATEEGEPALSIHRLGSRWIVRIPEVADFQLEEGRIAARLGPNGDPSLAELCLLGPVLALWFELRSVPVLHASVVAIDGRAVGLLAGPGAGKSTLAAELVAAGHLLLADDLLVADRDRDGWTARSGFPQLRLWPDACRLLVPGWQQLERVHPEQEKLRVPVGDDFGRWSPEPAPLARLYLPERRPSAAVTMETVSPGRRLIELLRHSFAARAVEALGLRERRLALLGDLADSVPVRRVVSPPGLGALGELRRTLEDDLETGR